MSELELNASGTDIPFELASLERATNYQEWMYQAVAPFMGERILEIGSGIGNMSRWLPVRERLILTENDPGLLLRLGARPELTRDPRIKVSGFDLLNDAPDVFFDEKIDTIVSFNVLEHVEDDFEVLAKLCRILERGDPSRPRRLVALVPAHQWAYGAMDVTLKHFRRYNRSRWKELRRRVAPEARLRLRSFNIVGLLGWFTRGRLMRRPMIGDTQIDTFNRLCPVIAPVDDFLQNRLRLPFGQSLIAVLEWLPKPNE